MDFILFFSLAAIIATVIALTVSKIKKHLKKDELFEEENGHYIVKLPDWFFWLMYIYTWLLGSVFAYCLFIQKDTFTLIGWLLSMPILLFGVVTYFAGKAWRIDVFKDKDYFIFRNIFFVTRKIYYSECIGYKYTMNSVVVKTEKRKIYVDYFLINSEYFNAMLGTHGVKEIKRVPIKKLTDKHIVIRTRKLEVWITFVLLFLVCAILIPVLIINRETLTLKDLILSALLIVILVYFTLFEIVIWRIDLFVDEDYFLLRTIPFKTHKIYYDDCINYKIGSDYLILKTQKRKFRIALLSQNFDYLKELLIMHKVKVKIKKK